MGVVIAAAAGAVFDAAVVVLEGVSSAPRASSSASRSASVLRAIADAVLGARVLALRLMVGPAEGSQGLRRVMVGDLSGRKLGVGAN